MSQSEFNKVAGEVRHLESFNLETESGSRGSEDADLQSDMKLKGGVKGGRCEWMLTSSHNFKGKSHFVPPPPPHSEIQLNQWFSNWGGGIVPLQGGCMDALTERV